MEIDLTKDQQVRLKDFMAEVLHDFRKGDKGVVHAQVYEKFMSVYYINPKCSAEMCEIIKHHYPHRFKK